MHDSDPSNLRRRALHLVNLVLRFYSVFQWVGALALMGFAIWYFSGIFTYLVISLIISSLLRTPTNYINQLTFFGVKVPRFIAIIIAFALFLGLISLFVTLFIPLIQAQVKSIQNIDELESFVKGPIKEIEEFIISYINQELKPGFIYNSIQNFINDNYSFDQIGNSLASLVSYSSNILVGLIAVLFITFFFLYEKGSMRRYFISLIPNPYFEVSIAAINKVEKLLSNYLFGLLIQMVSIFTLASLGLMLAGVEYAITIAAFAAVANVIPFLGPLLGAIFGVLISIGVLLTNTAASEGSIEAIPVQTYAFLLSKILLVFGVVQLTDNVLFQPLIFSRSVKAHPLEIFLIVFVGGSIAGPLGMIAAIPSYTLFKVTFTELYSGYKQYQIFRRR